MSMMTSAGLLMPVFIECRPGCERHKIDHRSQGPPVQRARSTPFLVAHGGGVTKELTDIKPAHGFVVVDGRIQVTRKRRKRFTRFSQNAFTLLLKRRSRCRSSSSATGV